MGQTKGFEARNAVKMIAQFMVIASMPLCVWFALTWFNSFSHDNLEKEKIRLGVYPTATALAAQFATARAQYDRDIMSEGYRYYMPIVSTP